MTHAAPASNSAGFVTLVVVCVAVVAGYVAKTWNFASELGNTTGREAYYNRLIAGFSQGRLDLDLPVPAGLKALPDPYDPAANQPFRKQMFDPHRIHDLSYHQERLYLYFGVTPALLLFWPWHLLTGGHLFHHHAVALFSALGFLLSAGILFDVWRRYFAGVSRFVMGGGVLALGLANSVLVMMSRPDVWEVPISCGYALVMASLAALWQALHRPAQRLPWMILAATAYGLAVGARPSLLVGCPLLLVPLWARDAPEGLANRAGTVRLLAGVILPLAVIGAGLALYNHLRFQNPLEFGQQYQMAADRQEGLQHFQWSFFWYNFRLYFLSFAPWVDTPPYVADVPLPPMPPGHGAIDWPFGVLTNTPVTLAFLAAPLAGQRKIRLFLAALVLLFLPMAGLLCLFYGVCTRYQVEFHPALILIACIGALALAERLREHRVMRLAAAAIGTLALAYSVVFSTFKSHQADAFLFTQRALAADRAGDVTNAVGHLRNAVVADPRNPDPRFFLARHLEQSGQNTDAITEYEQLVKYSPNHAIARNNLAQLYKQSGRLADAVAQLEHAVRTKPDLFQAHFNLGVLYQESGDHARAIERFADVLKLQPDLALAFRRISISQAALGQQEAARRNYETARRLRPDLPEPDF